MCKAGSLLDDQTSMNAYLDLIKTWMKDTTSLVALSLASGRVVGVAVTRINSKSDKSDTYNRVLVRILSHGFIRKNQSKNVTRLSNICDTSYVNLIVD